ncbi:MAG TPA: methyltransferase domain-containing protein [Solirubrobacteraceae bacterium]|nr:methyltransferase domain-containing protein [Solirubrobacteraceae bacterium]
MSLRFDASTSRRLVASYQTEDIVEQRRIVREAIAARAGERVLDIGSGPALLAAELARAVGPDGSVDGIDISEDMLAIARAREPERGAGPMRFHAAPATELPFADASFDVVVCTQVYEYVPEIDRALAQAHRVLVPGGRLVILDTDWDSLVWRSPDAALMARVMRAWDEHLADPYLPRRLPGLLRAAGFTSVSSSAFMLLNDGYREDTFSAGLLKLITRFVPGRHGLSEADAQAWAAGLTALGEDYFFSLGRYLFVALAP